MYMIVCPEKFSAQFPSFSLVCQPEAMVKLSLIDDTKGREEDKRGRNLVTDLANIINNSLFGDVVLISKDGDRHWACRILLAARSPVFHTMLMNGVTVETTSLEVPLPSIRTRALLPILEYIYTGSLSTYSLSLRNAIDIIYGSRYFLLSELEELAISFLSAQSVETFCDGLGYDLPKYLALAVDMLSLDMDRQIFTLLVEAVTCSVQCVENFAGFSQEAMHVYLDMTRNDAMQLSAAEYLRLRCLLMWCAHSISFAAAQALSQYLPAVQPAVLKAGCGANASECEPYRSALAEFVKPWLPKVNFYRVHPHMITGFIETLGIIEPSHLLQIYRFHVMFAKDFYLLKWTDGFLPPDFGIHKEGSVVECPGDVKTFSFAATAAPLTRNAGVFEWAFVIERVCDSMGLGFCSADAFNEQALPYSPFGSSPFGSSPFGSTTIPASCINWLGYKENGWILCCTGNLYHSSKTFNDKVAYTSEFGEGARITVRICMVKGTCEFKIDNRTCGVAWKDIPDRVYPAVTMRSPGRVRIEPVRHDEIDI